MSTRLAYEWGAPAITLVALLLLLVGLTHLSRRWWVKHQSRRDEAAWLLVDRGRSPRHQGSAVVSAR